MIHDSFLAKRMHASYRKKNEQRTGIDDGSSVVLSGWIKHDD